MTVTLPTHVDAALAAIRAARPLMPSNRKGGELEQARFNLWKALSEQDLDGAVAWMRVLKVQAMSLPTDAAEIILPALTDLEEFISPSGEVQKEAEPAKPTEAELFTEALKTVWATYAFCERCLPDASEVEFPVVAGGVDFADADQVAAVGAELGSTFLSRLGACLDALLLRLDVPDQDLMSVADATGIELSEDEAAGLGLYEEIAAGSAADGAMLRPSREHVEGFYRLFLKLGVAVAEAHHEEGPPA